MTLDPNLVALLGSIAVAGLSWLYDKARGRKHASLSDQIDGFVDQGIHLAIVEADSNIDTIRLKVTGYVWLALAKAGIAKTPIAETLVAAGVEQAIGRALEAARAHDRALEVAIQANVNAAQADMRRPQAPGIAIPNIADNMTIVKLGPDDPMPTAAEIGTLVP